jgi:hypothetical protein
MWSCRIKLFSCVKDELSLMYFPKPTVFVVILRVKHSNLESDGPQFMNQYVCLIKIRHQTATPRACVGYWIMNINRLENVIILTCTFPSARYE